MIHTPASVLFVCVLLLLILPATGAQSHLINTGDLNPTLDVPRWKMYANPANPYEIWLLIADDHDQFFKSTDGGISWTGFDDTAANTFDSLDGGEIISWINYHSAMTGHGADLWVTHPSDEQVFLQKISGPGDITADIGLPEEIITDLGLRKRSNVVATADELFVITRTTNNPEGNVRYFRYTHEGALVDSGWVVDLDQGNVRVGSTLDSQGQPVVLIWVDGARLEYYRWNGSSFIEPADSLVWDASDATVGCSASALTREYAFTVTDNNTLHAFWSCTAESVKHAYKVMGDPNGWTYNTVVDHPEQDNYLFRASVTHRGDNVWMFVSLDVNNDGSQSNIWYRQWDPVAASWNPLVQLTFDNVENRQPNTVWKVPAGAPAIPFMYWKGGSAVYTDRIPLGGSGTVPSGGGVHEGLALSKAAGGDLSLSWSVSCLSGDSDFGIYEGALGNFASHLPNVCSTFGLTEQLLTPGSGSVYFLVVPQGSGKEGSYGANSAGDARPTSVAPCLAQEIVSCP